MGQGDKGRIFKWMVYESKLFMLTLRLRDESSAGLLAKLGIMSRLISSPRLDYRLD